VTVLFALLEVVALSISFKMFAKARLGLVLAVAGLVPIIVVLLSAARVPWLYFGSPPGAAALFLAFVLLTFLLLYAGLHFTKRQGS
jgi:hypothetical protein